MEKHEIDNNGRPILKGSPKKLPAGLGWGVLLASGQNPEPGDTVQVTTRRGKQWLPVLVREFPSGVWSTEDTQAQAGTTRERLENRAERRGEWAESREQKRDAAWAESRSAADLIPIGQPILAGHHSENRHRKDIKRIDNKGLEGLEHHRMVERHNQAANTINLQLREAIFDDDENAVEQLQARISLREAKKNRIKAINAYARKHGTTEGFDLTPEELEDLKRSAKGGHDPNRGYPAYALTGLGGKIRRDKERLAHILECRSTIQGPC